MTPVGSLGGKKRRVPPSNSGVRCAAKNMKVEVKKAPEKSAANPLDDKVVSSSCEVECSNAVSCSTSAKTPASRSSLDYFVHTTQKLEVTTSSTDGDLVDLTEEDESACEAVALSSTCTPAESDVVDVMPAAVSDDCVIKMSEPDGGEPDIKTSLVDKPAEMEKVNNGTTNDAQVVEVQCSKQEDVQKPACGNTGSSHCDGRQNVQEVDGSADTQVDSQNTSNDDSPTRSRVACVAVSPEDVSSSDADDDDVDMAESPMCDDTDNSAGKLSQPAVVLVKLDDGSAKAADGGEKVEVSTTSANMNSDGSKVTADDNQKPKVG